MTTSHNIKFSDNKNTNYLKPDFCSIPISNLGLALEFYNIYDNNEKLIFLTPLLLLQYCILIFQANKKEYENIKMAFLTKLS